MKDVRKLRVPAKWISESGMRRWRELIGLPNSELWPPFKRLPNVRSFKVRLDGYDELFAKHGILKRRPPEFVWKHYENRRLNRYIEHQLIRLRDADEITYWRIVRQLLRSSTVFWVMAMNHVLPKWHRTEKLHFVLKVAKKAMQLARENMTDIDFKRVYISKQNGKLRPLGVPKLWWRLYLHLINQFLVFRLKNKSDDSQHAFLPKRGTLTAWKEIMLKVIDSPNIYEIDLKGFFDNVETGWISKEMEHLEIPIDVIYWFQDLWKSLPKLPEKLPPDADESIVLEKAAINENDASSPDLSESLKIFDELGEFGDVLISEQLEEEGLPANSITAGIVTRKQVILKIIEIQWALFASFSPTHPTNPTKVSSEPFLNYFKGVPQGAATSVSQSVLALRPLIEAVRRWERGWITGESTERAYKICSDLVGYADDWVLYGEEFDEGCLTGDKLKQAGITINKEKSGWVKKNGKWLKRLKFLGLSYDGPTDKLYASTRKGADLEFDRKDLVLAVAAREGGRKKDSSEGASDALDSDSTESWLYFVKSSIAGFIQSRLYQNSWNLSEFEQNFDLDYIKSSWVEKYAPTIPTPLTVFNSTSFASASLCLLLKQKVRWERLKKKGPLNTRGLKWKVRRVYGKR